MQQQATEEKLGVGEGDPLQGRAHQLVDQC